MVDTADVADRVIWRSIRAGKTDRRRASELACDVVDVQVADRMPMQDDTDRGNGDPGIGRHRYEFVDRQHDLQMVKRGLPIPVRGFGKRFKLGEQIRGYITPPGSIRRGRRCRYPCRRNDVSCRIAIYHARAGIGNPTSP